MLSNLIKNETQLVTCGYRRVFEKNKMLIENNEKILNTTNIKEYLETTKENYLYNELWNKMYISEIIKEHNIKFDKSYELGEDFLFNLDYTKYIKKASINIILFKYYVYINYFFTKFTNFSLFFDIIIDFITKSII